MCVVKEFQTWRFVSFKRFEQFERFRIASEKQDMKFILLMAAIMDRIARSS
jgi:hypothetical protein